VWNEITNQNDLDAFINLFGGFHDSCIKEFKYVSGAFVNENLSMYPINNKRDFKIIFQRQFNNPSVVEMEFTGLLRLSMSPVDENYTCEILDATMILSDNCVYWYDCERLTENELSTYTGTLICASKVRWRVAEEYIGHNEIYSKQQA
jgi:hypothetical protein